MGRLEGAIGIHVCRISRNLTTVLNVLRQREALCRCQTPSAADSCCVFVRIMPELLTMMDITMITLKPQRLSCLSGVHVVLELL